MTQEEKLEEAKRLYETANADQKYVLERLFPELKESDDERIRKDIVFYIAAHHKDDGEKARWLYWLEKQGGHAKFINGIQVGDKVTRNEDGVLVNLSQLNRVAKKQGEQKPVVIPKFKIGDRVRLKTDPNDIETVDNIMDEYYIFDKRFKCNHILISDQNLWELVEQKPAWSEEDKEHIKSLLERLDGMCKKNATFVKTRFAISEDEDWLKSLKDRYTWKPSDEQMDMLRIAVSTSNSIVLNSLYNDLMKLKG